MYFLDKERAKEEKKVVNNSFVEDSERGLRMTPPVRSGPEWFEPTERRDEDGGGRNRGGLRDRREPKVLW